MKKETKENVGITSAFGISAVCVLSGACFIAVPIMGATAVYCGANAIVEAKKSKKK